jgi:hypothetical protein
MIVARATEETQEGNMVHVTKTDAAAIRRVLDAKTPQELRAAVRALSDEAYKLVQTHGSAELRRATEQSSTAAEGDEQR